MSAPIGELIGLAVAILVLTLVFRCVAAMLLTLIASLIALAGGILLLQLRRRPSPTSRASPRRSA